MKNTGRTFREILTISIHPPTLSTYLGRVDTAIMLEQYLDKYKEVCRSARVTIIFSEEQLDWNDIKTIGKKIFVYPETLDFFFINIYKYIENEFELFTVECEFTKKKWHKYLDINKKIINTIIIFHDITPLYI